MKFVGEMFMGEHNIKNVHEMFRKELILVEPEADSAEQLLTIMGEIVQNMGYAEPTFTEHVIRREQVYPTGLSTMYMNMAVPHTDACHVIKQAIVVAKLKKPIPFHAMGMDEETIMVDYVFMLLLKNDGAQVPLLQKLMNMCADENVTDSLKKAASSEEILSTIQNYYITARAEI